MPSATPEFAILGAGAMGSIVAAHLARAGHSVVVLARAQRARDIQQHGLRIKGLIEFTQPVEVISDPATFRGAGVLIVGTKTHGTDAALAPIARADIGVAFSMQNGMMKNDQLISALGRQRVLGSLADASGEVLPFSTAEWFRTRSGRGELTPVPMFAAPTESRAHAAKGAYPLEFLPRKADNYMNSTFANLPVHQRMEVRTAGVLEMHSNDAAARAIVSGDEVEVFNGRGSIALKALVNGHVSTGVVAARLDWNKLSAGGLNVNALTSETLTDLGGGPTFYSTLVEVRKVCRV